MKEKLSTQYNDAVQQIKAAILKSQAKALAGVNQAQLALYYGIGRYISVNTREGVWGKGALETISEQLRADLPGLRGFPSRKSPNNWVFRSSLPSGNTSSEWWVYPRLNTGKKVKSTF